MRVTRWEMGTTTILPRGAIKISTDEADVSAFIKLFVESGARVEVYSAHHYPDKPAQAD